MKMQYDFKKEWPAVKKQLMQLSQEALTMAKKGEKEIVRISKQGKLHLDSAALALKKEHLYYSIGKEYVKVKCPGQHSLKLKQLIDEMNKIDKQMDVLKKRMETKQASTLTGTGGRRKQA